MLDTRAAPQTGHTDGMNPDGEILDADNVDALPGQPVAVVEQTPGVFTVADLTFSTLEDLVWAIGRRLTNGQVLLAYRVDFDYRTATVTVATLNPDGTSHEDTSHLLGSAEADRVMLALAG